MKTELIPLLDEPTISLPRIDFTLPGQRDPWDKPKADDAMEQAYRDILNTGLGVMRHQHIPTQDLFQPGLLRKQAE